MIKEKRVIVVNGAGGPANDSIPVYGSDKAPNGDWAYQPDGVHQLMIKNGTELISVDPDLVTPAENDDFFSFKANGQINYARVWFIGEDGHGKPTQQLWVEYNKLQDAGGEPEPEPEPEPTGEWTEIPYRFENGKLFLKL